MASAWQSAMERSPCQLPAGTRLERVSLHSSGRNDSDGPGHSCPGRREAAFAVAVRLDGNASLGIDANLNGAAPFPADNDWNSDISKAKVDPNSDNLIASIGLDTGLHPDFGSGA
jgi:hypothetical protein